jgi:toxin HigB-1
VIASFRDRATEGFWNEGRSPKIGANIAKVARRKLVQLAVAKDLRDLKQPPNNHLEALRGGREGQHSIRVNDQFRICFEWREGAAYNVEIVDYH